MSSCCLHSVSSRIRTDTSQSRFNENLFMFRFFRFQIARGESHTITQRTVAPFPNSFWLQHASYRRIYLFFVFRWFSPTFWNKLLQQPNNTTHTCSTFSTFVGSVWHYIRHKIQMIIHIQINTYVRTHTHTPPHEIKCNFSHAFLNNFFLRKKK